MYLFASDLILHLKILQARKQRWRNWRKMTQILSRELSHQPKGKLEIVLKGLTTTAADNKLSMHIGFPYSRTCLKQPLKRRPKIVFQDRLSLNAVQKYCRMLQESILQYFWPSLSYHLSLRSLFCLFLSGRFRQVLLYLSHKRDRSDVEQLLHSCSK